MHVDGDLGADLARRACHHRDRDRDRSPHVVLTTNRLQGSWCVTLFGTEPRRRKRDDTGHAAVADDEEVVAVARRVHEGGDRVVVDGAGVDLDAGRRVALGFLGHDLGSPVRSARAQDRQ